MLQPVLGPLGRAKRILYEFRGRDYPSSSEEERVERLAAESVYQGLVISGEGSQILKYPQCNLLDWSRFCPARS